MTHSLMAVWDIHLNTGKQLTLNLPEKHTCVIVVLHGTVTIANEVVRESQVALLNREEKRLELITACNFCCSAASRWMNRSLAISQVEIDEAIQDFESDRFIRVH